MDHQSALILYIRQHTHMYTFEYSQVLTHTCHTPTHRGQDYVSPLSIQGRGGKNWIDYRRLIEGGEIYKDVKDNHFDVETTVGEDVE